MSKTRRKIYIKIDQKKSEIIYSGIEFAEFNRYLLKPIKNLMLLTGGSNAILLETKYERGLELFEGHNLVNELAEEDIYSLGDFCFVDYDSADSPIKLTEEEFAEILYLGHVFKPLHTPFFTALQNRFAYLAHDDGWYCKLYCQNISDFIEVVCKKIENNVQAFFRKEIPALSEDIKETLCVLATNGLFFNLENIFHCKNNSISIKLYTIGTYMDMDTILNGYQDIIQKASQVNYLTYTQGDLSFTWT